MTKLSMCMSSSICELKSCSCEVVIGGTRGVRLLTILCCVCRHVREGLVHLENSSEGFDASGHYLSCCSVGCVSTWGGETDSSPLKSTGDFCVSRDFGGRGIARLPSSSQLQRVHLRRRCVLRRRKDCTQAFLFTTSACTSEEEGKAFFLTKSASSSEEEEQVLLLTMRVCTSEEEGQAFFLTMSVSTCSPCFVLSSACQLRGESLRCECACVGEQRKLVRWLPRRTWKRTLQVQVGVKQSRSGPGFILHGDDF